MQNGIKEMSAKEYLSQVRRGEADITRLNCDKQNLYEILYSLGGTREGERVQTSKNADRFGSIFVKIEEKDCLIEKKLKELIDFKIEVADEICTLSEPKYAELLYKRYIQFKSFKQIADDMGYSYRYVIKIHGYALLEFEKKMPKRCTNNL